MSAYVGVVAHISFARRYSGCVCVRECVCVCLSERSRVLAIALASRANAATNPLWCVRGTTTNQTAEFPWTQDMPHVLTPELPEEMQLYADSRTYNLIYVHLKNNRCTGLHRG